MSDSNSGPIDPRQAFGDVPPPPPGNALRPPQPPMPPRPPMGPPPFLQGPPPKQRGNIGSAILTSCATVLFAVSLFGNVLFLGFILLGYFASKSIDPVDLQIIQTTAYEGGRSKIAVIPIEGIITNDKANDVRAFLNRARQDPNVKAIVLSIDSPGGGVTPSDEIYADILQYKADTGDYVVAHLNGLAASGGYYVACAADEIVAQRTTLTGSIGVLLQRYDLTGLSDKVGIADGSIVSTGAAYKTTGDPFSQLTTDEREYLTSVIDDSFTTFKTVVTAARQPAMNSAGASIDEVANGKIFSSDQAQKLGLIDVQGYRADAYARAEAGAGINNATVIRYDMPVSPFEGLLGVDAPIGGKAGLNIELGGDLIDELTTPRLLYLWRGN
ncbi:MAG: signal peptide peptidase SppA [Planctomycetota bacterium]